MERVGGKESLELGTIIISFIGPEGSGKTTQAKRLAQEIGKPYITTGDTIRYLAENDKGPLGDECRDILFNSAYLSGESLLKILIDRFSKEDCRNGFVLDGGFRTVEETVGFREMLKVADRDFPLKIVSLGLPEEISYKRLLDGPNARKRKDDTREGIAGRLEKFNFRFSERIAAIKKEEGWEIVEIDAGLSPEKVYESIVDKLTNPL